MPALPDQDPRITRSRAVITAAASEHFLRTGYAGANMDDIAAEANVSKRTVYNLFGGKEQLFREILAEAIATAERFSHNLAVSAEEVDDLEQELGDLGTRLAVTVLGGRVVRLRRLLISEAERFPELAHDYYERAPGKVMSTLAAAIETWAQRGRLRVDEPRLAAEHFAFLVMGAPLDRALFDPHAAPPNHAAIETAARAGAAAFWRAYRAPVLP